MTLRTEARGLYIRAAVALGLDDAALWLHVKRTSRTFGAVIEVHDTPPQFADKFREQLQWVAQRFRIVSLETFAAEIWNGVSAPHTDRRPLALFTFDDGRESNYSVAAPLLESYGARGVFFVVPDFIEAGGDALSFYRSKVNPDFKPENELTEDWKPMSPAQVADLAARGHAVGSHTLAHARLAGLSSDELEREIGDSARKIASWTGKPVDAFAWTFSWDSVDRAAWEAIRRYHRYCFTPCAGSVDGRHDDPSLIWRREIEVHYSRPEFRFFYSGLGDFSWAGRRRRLRKILGATRRMKS